MQTPVIYIFLIITNKSGHKIWPLFVLIVQLEFELDIMGLVVDT